MQKTKLALFLFCILLLSGCQKTTPTAPASTPTPAPAASRTFLLVVKDTTNPYMMKMFEGFEQACREKDITAALAGPDQSGEPRQSESILDAIERGVDAIAVAANDPAALSAALGRAEEAGIPVISLDAMVDPGDRKVHIQQASPETIGRVLIQAGAEIMDWQGELAILTTTTTMPNQVSWVRWMAYELASHPEKYRNISLVATEYGLDEPEASTKAAAKLLDAYPDLKLIIAPTVVGLRAAARVVSQSNSAVKVTGLGLPSEMEPYITQGACPWMYLWNPTELGYLAAYAADGLAQGTLTGAVGEILSAGTLGDKVVTLAEDGGTEIVLGNPKMFDPTNIMLWKEVF